MKRAPMLMLALLLPGLSLAGDERIEQIKKMGNDRLQAGVRKDVEAIAAVTADDYFQIDWNGQVLNKAATLARIIRYGRVYVHRNGIWQVVAFQQTPVAR